MIEFEGFGLKNTEQNIIDKQFSTRPRILKQFMTALGAKEGKSSTKRYEWQTADQKDLWQDTLKGYKDLDYQGPGKFTEGKKADELEGFKAQDFDSLRRLQDENQLSVAGLDKLRNYRATAATQVNPDIAALRKIGDQSDISFDHRLAETTRKARRKLQESDIAARRGPAGRYGGSALARLGNINVTDYGRTVGQAAAGAVEEADYRNRQLAMQSRMQAGQLGMGISELGLRGLTTAQHGELGELSMRAQDLADRRGIHSRERQYMAQNELGRARYSAERADARNLWNQSNAQAQNQWELQALAGKSAAANQRTFEDVVTKTKGTPGFGGTLLTVGGAVAGGMIAGPAGATAGAQLGQGLAQSSGDYGSDPMASAVASGTSMYAGMNQGGNRGYNASQVPPSMRGMGSRPQTDYSWWQDDPNSGWWDTMGRSDQQLGLDRQEDLYAQQRWDRRFANRQNFLGHQNQLHQNFRMFQPQTHPYYRG